MREKTARRLVALEARQGSTQLEPVWLSVQTEADLPAALAARRWPPAKVYIGVSPDDWDDDWGTGDETSTAAPTSA